MFVGVLHANNYIESGVLLVDIGEEAENPDTLPFDDAAMPVLAPLDNFSVSSGEATSATGTGLDLRLVWSAEAYSSGNATFNISLYIDYTTLVLKSDYPGTLKIGDTVYQFTLPAMRDVTNGTHSTGVFSVTHIEENPDRFTSINVTLPFGLTYNGVMLDRLDVNALAEINYDMLPHSASLDVKNIMQKPALPNGCEITSFTILTQYLGYKTDKLTMARKYLEQGVPGKTDFRIANVGNPESNTNSFGCYSPVIMKSAEKYFAENGGEYSPFDLTGTSPESLYYSVSQGMPVIVWITMDINTEPYVLRSWKLENGETINWKHPLHCVVLTGYDIEARTVTLCDPLKGVVTQDMDLFELRYMQMGNQAVMCLKSS
jgi:uncharacterized protein YvpB